MRPLLQHASRSFTAKVAFGASSPSRPVGAISRVSPLLCLRCPYRAASTLLRSTDEAPSHPQIPGTWSRRQFSSSAKWFEEGKPPNSSRSVPIPPLASEQKPVSGGQVKDNAREIESSLEGQGLPQDDLNTLLERKNDAPRMQEGAVAVPQQPSTLHKDPKTTANKDDVADNITRVPDEHLPSHRERQRWDLSKRFSEAMDELLPKLAVVTQKVNTYTGTDYSGVEALRREIKEQENLVRARRAAIDTSKQALDTAHAQQASAQKEVVALLERKHSWSAGDLERYMSLIRSEHINDQAIRLAKDSVINAEAALEEARTQLEKRERAQYHEEQIWSDTIRRNSTWVTFGLMGVNIFLLLLSLAILEPWRRRRMVREIKSALEAQQAVNKPASASSVTAVASSTTEQDIALIGEDVDQITDIDETKLNPATSAALETVVEDLPAAEAIDDLPVNARPEAPESVADPVSDITVPIAAIAAPNNEESTSYLESGFRQEASGRDGSRGKPNGWQSKITSIAQDVISERIISMRRIDYTTAILQGAAAGAVITAAIIAMLRST